jgi:hypothetical protein
MQSRYVLLTIALCALASSGRAQNGRGAPTGAEIAQKARSAKFNHANSGGGTFQGKAMKLTPATLTGVSLDQLKAGQVVGQLDAGAAGDETGLPPGRYNLYMAYVDGQWRAYAESGGRIASPAILTELSTSSGKAPQFVEKGWCFYVYFGGLSMQSIVSAYYGGANSWRVCF